jgi:ubiquitin-protein ligase
MVDEDGNVLDGYGIILETAWDSDNEEDEEEDEKDEDDEEQDGGAGGKKKGGKSKHDSSDESDFDSEDDDDEDDEDEDDEDDDDKLAPGYVRVAWPDRVEEEIHHSCLRLIDRSFLHGDVIVPRSNPQGQIGTVIEVQVLADVTFPAVNGGADEITLKQVSTKILEPPHPFIIGRYATRGAMLGMVQNCMVEIDVAFGKDPFKPLAVCTVKQPAPSIYKPQLENSEEVHEDEVGNGVYYPGLRVRAKHAAWKKCTWTTGKHDGATAAGDEGTVLRVRPTQVHVEWISGDSSEVGEDGEAKLRPEEVKLLGLFEDSRWQVGDHCELEKEKRREEKEKVIAKHAPASSEESKDGSSSSSSAAVPTTKGKKGKGKAKAPPTRDWNQAFAFCGTVTRTYTSIRIQWQDGSITDTLSPAVDYISRTHLLENDFLPEDFAVVQPSCRLVTVVKVDAAERMVRVRYGPKRLRQYEEGEWWEQRNDQEEKENQEEADRLQAQMDGVPRSSMPPPADAASVPNDNPLVFVAPPRAPESLDENDHKEEGFEEWVSVFELRTNPAFEFCLGGAVIRIPGTLDDAASSALPSDARMGYPGQVVRVAAGKISVVWADLTETTHEPDQLMIVEHDEDDDEDEDYEDDEEDEDFEECPDCEECEGPPGCDCECHEDEADVGEEEEEPVAEGAAAASVGQVANDEFPSEWMSAGHWKKSQPASDAAGSSSVPPPADAQVEGAVSSFSHLSLASAAAALSSQPSLPYIDAASARPGYSYSSFDIIEAPEESEGASSVPVPAASPSAPSAPSKPSLHHKFATDPFVHEAPKAFMKRVREEWKLLRQNLPPGIHVITYEHRIDLFKLLIVGNSDTPYFLNVFQFDVQLPTTYPAEPPKIHFYSRGNRLNPNLYVDGHVCNSLLNTWKAAQASERWDPVNSNLLQVFVSLQGLVIGTGEPYYLEAGYERQQGSKTGDLNSHLYNETALVSSLQHLTSYVSTPLSAHPFVTVVLEHALSRTVRERMVELDRLAHEWVGAKRAQLQQFTGGAAAASASASSSAAPASSAPLAEASAQVEGAGELDTRTLYPVLARFGIRAGNELNAAAPQPGAAAASAESPAVVHYHPSLGFVCMLVRQTSILLKAMDARNAANDAAAGGNPSSSSSSK